MEEYWCIHPFYTGNKTEDAVVRKDVSLMVQASKYVLLSNLYFLLEITIYSKKLFHCM